MIETGAASAGARAWRRPADMIRVERIISDEVDAAATPLHSSRRDMVAAVRAIKPPDIVEW
jgi:hypothetical protein